MTGSTIDDVARYAAAVRAALADLDEGARRSLLEDLEAHLSEVAAESDVPLAQRLGRPEAYAAELRAAYGASARGDATGPRRARRFRRLPGPVRRHPRLTVVAGLAVLAVALFVIHVASSQGTGAEWQYHRLISEADAGHVRAVTIAGGTAVATDASGIRHEVNVPDDTSNMARALTADNVDVTYQQSSIFPIGIHVQYLVVLLLIVVVPNLLLLTALFLGVRYLYRLGRRPAR